MSTVQCSHPLLPQRWACWTLGRTHQARFQRVLVQGSPSGSAITTLLLLVFENLACCECKGNMTRVCKIRDVQSDGALCEETIELQDGGHAFLYNARLLLYLRQGCSASVN